MWWALGVIAVAAVLSAYLGWTAHRVERVHMRAQSAARALQAHLLRRAAAAAVVAERADLDELYAAARLALDAEPGEREHAENDLTRQLQLLPLAAGAAAASLGSPATALPAAGLPLAAADPAMRTLIATSRRAVLARQVHTDLVRDALTARRRPLVRVLGMARRYPVPTYFEIVEPTVPHLPVVVPAPAPAESAVAVEAV
jgi:hypothetical protein